MLAIHPVINQNYRMKPSFGIRFEEPAFNDEYPQTLDELKRQRDEKERQWLERRSEMQEMIDNKEAPVVKPLKTALKWGIVGSAAALGALGTGYSARYLIEQGQAISKSKQMQNFGKFLSKHISEPVAKGIKSVKTFVGKQINKVKTSKTYTENKAKLSKKNEAFKNSSFAQFFSENAKKISDNKVVQKITGFVDGIFSGIAEGVVKLYNKIAGINRKDTVANTLGAAGGISIGAETLMKQNEEAAKEKAEKGIEDEYVSYEEV